MRAIEFQYCPNCGNPIGQAERFGRTRPVCDECGYIHFYDPKVAVAVLIEHRQQILLIKRNNQPARGLWSVPGGFVDAGEDPAQAAIREVREETGLNVRITALLDVVYDREYKNSADFVIYYRAEMLNGQLSPGDDAETAAWFFRHELPALAFRSVGIILEKFQETLCYNALEKRS